MSIVTDIVSRVTGGQSLAEARQSVESLRRQLAEARAVAAESDKAADWRAEADLAERLRRAEVRAAVAERREQEAAAQAAAARLAALKAEYDALMRANSPESLDRECKPHLDEIRRFLTETLPDVHLSLDQIEEQARKRAGRAADLEKELGLRPSARIPAGRWDRLRHITGESGRVAIGQASQQNKWPRWLGEIVNDVRHALGGRS